MKNTVLSELFDQMADIMEILGEDRFRINTYRKVARIISDMPTDVETLHEDGISRLEWGVTDDPEGNGIELYWDVAADDWPRGEDGKIQMYTRALDLDALAGIGRKLGADVPVFVRG